VNKKLKIALWILALVLAGVEFSVYWVQDMTSYILIYNWLIYAINYLMAMILFIATASNRFVKWLQWLIGILIVAVTTAWIFKEHVNLIVSTSDDGKHEVILKEYANLNDKTVQLQRRHLIFGRKMDTLIGSSTYKTIAEKTYTINWVGGQTAVVTYKTAPSGPLEQKFINFRWSKNIGYYNVGVSLTGKWIERGHPQNYFLYDKGKMIYAGEGKLYTYIDVEETQQLGIYGIKLIGGKQKPSFTIVLNSDSQLEPSGLIADGGTITICPLSLNAADYKVYKKVE